MTTLDIEETGRRIAVDSSRLADEPQIGTVTGLLTDGAARMPGAELLRFGGESWTYEHVDAASSRLAHMLIAVHGIAPGDRVAIMLPNVTGWPLTWFAVLKAGAVAVPVNSAYRAADLRFVLEDSGTRVIVTDADHLPLVHEVIASSSALIGVAAVDIAESSGAEHPSTAPTVDIRPDTLANLQYTSGTTGFPKACMLTHDYWTRIGWTCAGAAGLGPDDVLLTAQPFSYMDPQWNTVMALTTGAPLVVLPKFSASGFMRDVRRHGATFCYVLGSMPTLLFKQPPGPEDRDNRLRGVFCSAIPVALHAALEERWGAPWREVYGMTESGIDLFSPFPDTAAVGSGTLGHPVPTKQVRIVDTDGAEVPAGTPGELTVAGVPMMLGYWNRPEETARTLRDGHLHTGDLAVKDERGGIRLVGRLKDMVRRGGENVAAAEVEAALERDDAVVATAVVAEPDDVLGEEVKAFVQVAASVAEDRSTAEAIVARVAEGLARFKVPRYVEFVADFPRTPSERVSKPVLKARAAQAPGTVHDLRAPVPSNKENQVENTDQATENVLVEVTREVAVITLRRPEKLNALTAPMRRRLSALIREYGAGDKARGIVLTGTGRAFSAGEDLAAAPTSFEEMRESFESFHDVTRAVIETRVPVIAAINGIAVGGASEITLCCDARFGTPQTEYYQPENGRGLTVSNASSILLPRIVRSHAMRMVLASERIGADEALEIGLLDEIVEPEALLDRAVDTVHAWTPEGVNNTALHLELLRPSIEEIESAFEREDAAADESWNSGAFTAGVQGFWNARTPATVNGANR
ncbi:AMP-binding protein [Gordonia malaquae]|uniref:AMP-binding protein n=1 Tax=Gordonia malaquae TaxID=410332 RepID=UPI003AFAE5B4